MLYKKMQGYPKADVRQRVGGKRRKVMDGKKVESIREAHQRAVGVSRQSADVQHHRRRAQDVDRAEPVVEEGGRTCKRKRG